MTLSTFDQLFSYDPKKSEDGVKEIVGVNAKGKDVVFHIAEAGSEKHEKVQRRYAKMLEKTRKTPKEHDKVIARIIAEALLVNWEGVLDDKQKPIEPTVENKTEMLVKYRRLRQKVMEVAVDEERYLPEGDDQAEEDTEGN
jgi:hypothetical protein